ncbi:hypothetical protein N9W41_01310, partial [bacterium]|nr:hypothetical protein [bacterium]
LYRAIRFSTQLGFKIEKSTYKAISECSKHDFKISKERIMEELSKILQSPMSYNGIQELDNFDLLNSIFQVGKFNYYELGFVKRALKDLSKFSLPVSYLLSLFYLIKHINKQDYSLKGLKQSKKTVSDIQNVIQLYDMIYEDQPLEDTLVFLSDKSVSSLIAVLEVSLDKAKDLKRHIDPYIESWPEPYLNGKDLIELKFEDKTKYKSILNKVYGQQLTGKLASKEEALSFVSSNFK